ncbi:MAG: AAA family ATPase, partial [Acidobacteriota bacterium]
MPTVRFVAAHLAYGCHTRDFELPEAERPIVVHGPNGSGKSTFLEGLVRTLFGFDRRRGDDGRIHETRRPWGGGGYSGRVCIECLDGTERWIERDFDSAEVRILVEDREIWQGSGNPGGTNQEAVDYRRRLREMFGLAELAEYERTACAHQGQLVQTHLGDELIQAASGGGVDVDEAREAIRARHRELTLEPIVDRERAANKRRELERSLERIDELASRLEAVRRAEQERLPLVRDESRLLETIADLDRRIGRLEDAWEKVSSRKGQQAEKRAAEARLRSLERLERKLTAATRAATSMQEIHESLGDRPAYPDDFVERAATARRLQEEHRRLRQERDRLRETLAEQTRSVAWPLVAAAATLATAVLLAWTGARVPAAVVVGLVLLGAVLVAGRYLKRRTERRGALRQVENSLTEVGAKIEICLDGVPHVDDPAEFDLEPALDRFRTREATGRKLRSARGHLQEVMSDARSELRDAYGDLPRDPAGLLELLHRAIGEHRDRLATVELWLAQAAAPDLP